MTGIERQLESVEIRLKQGNLGLAIMEMETYLAAYPQKQTKDRLNSIKSEYELMKDYWVKGANDPQQGDLYQHLLQRVYVLYANVAAYQRIIMNPTLSNIYSRVRQEQREWSLKNIRKEMEDFVSNVAMLELEPEHTRGEKREKIYKDHQAQMNTLFNYILTSRMWSDGIGHDFEEILISPTIDVIDQQLLVSAVTLSLFNQFDMAKFRTLVNVYRRSQEEVVRQRALVGWTLGIDSMMDKVYPEQKEMVWILLQSKQVCEELTELQIQLIYTLNAERDNETINNEIIPNLLKNSDLKITKDGDKFGIVEKEDDPMEDILHPDAAEERIQKMETSLGKMLEMQKQGSDIYYGGFSQMKRFPFFYDVSNWLVPFFIDHPDIKHFVSRLKDNQFVLKVVNEGPFCSSDKYSFLFSISQVLDKVPQHLKDMMNKGEATLNGVGIIDHEELNSPTYIRRSYLMDLYRFFRVYPSRIEFQNPFDTDIYAMGNSIFFEQHILDDSPIEDYKDQIVKLLFRLKHGNSARSLLASYSENHRDVQYYIWCERYEDALELDPENKQAKLGLAKELFKDKEYEDSLYIFDELLVSNPDNLQYLLYKATCQVYLKQYDEALKVLYRLTYENPDNKGAKRALGWALLCTSQLEQADKLFKELVDVERIFAEDLLNYGYSCWFSGRINEAIDYFKKYYLMLDEHQQDRFSFDDDLMAEYQITDAQMNMMMAAIAS